jgi:hypothetical protein
LKSKRLRFGRDGPFGSSYDYLVLVVTLRVVEKEETNFERWLPGPRCYFVVLQDWYDKKGAGGIGDGKSIHFHLYDSII